jgi:hypothetical protein
MEMVSAYFIGNQNATTTGKGMVWVLSIIAVSLL